MKKYWLCIFCLFVAIQTQAAVDPVTLKLPMPTGWAGQRIPLIFELRAPGSFSGTATFELPQLDGALVVKIGSPTVSSEEIDGESWVVQSHEFALFAQRPGVLMIPPFAVHFAHQQGFSGPVSEVASQTPAGQVEIKQPPGLDPTGFFLTTESFTVRETWEPKPGPVQVGAMFKRTIVQQASNVSGMALAPAPNTAPDGMRLYPGTAETKDSIDRGDLVGERRETLTYLVAQPGTLTLPALTYSWWNPKTEQVQSATLDAVMITATPAPATHNGTTKGLSLSLTIWLCGAVALIVVAILVRRKLVRWGERCLHLLFPPEEKARHRLLAACGRNDAPAAKAAWYVWLQLKGESYQVNPEVHCAVLELQSHLYRSGSTESWQGEHLKNAIEKQLATGHARTTHPHSSALPVLNP